MRPVKVSIVGGITLLAVGVFLALTTSGDRLPNYNTDSNVRLLVATHIDPLGIREDEGGTYSGFEYDYLKLLGKRLNRKVEVIKYPNTTSAINAVIDGQAHLAAGGLTRDARYPVSWTAALRKVDYVLVRGRGNERAEISQEKDLAGRSIMVRADTYLAGVIKDIQRRVPTLKIVHPATNRNDQELLKQLAEGHIDLLATEKVQFDHASRSVSDLVIAWDLPQTNSVAWALPAGYDAGLMRIIDEILDDADKSGDRASIEDRYFVYVRRLTAKDISLFRSRIKTHLPKYEEEFVLAGSTYKLDWRYIAAISYQESLWEESAKSYTGVLGLMMLTTDTAARMGVRDRTNPVQAIMGGSRYLAELRQNLEGQVPDPDRMWMVTAAYNIGPASLEAARKITHMQGKNDASWADIKAILPTLSDPSNARRFNTGPIRGGEAVIMTENIRNYYDLLREARPMKGGIPVLLETTKTDP